MHGLYVKRYTCSPENYANNCLEVPRYVLFLPDQRNRKALAMNKYE